MATEKLKYKLELFATMWDQPPHAEILVNDQSCWKGAVEGTEDKPTLIQFECTHSEDADVKFEIKRSNKTNNQTVVNAKGDILKDQMLHIKKIEIDEIALSALVYEGEYFPEYPEPWATQQRESGQDLRDSFKNVTAMGFNGTWRFNFRTPFYMWLLENLY